MVSGHHAYNKIMVPQLDLWETLLGGQVRLIFHEDNEAMIQVIRTGKNPTMRQLGRVHRVAIATLHERMGKIKNDLQLRNRRKARPPKPGRRPHPHGAAAYLSRPMAQPLHHARYGRWLISCVASS